MIFLEYWDMDLRLQVSSEPPQKILGKFWSRSGWNRKEKLSKSKLKLARDLPSCDPALAAIFRTGLVICTYICTSEISIFRRELQPGEDFVNFSLTPSTMWVDIHTIERRLIYGVVDLRSVWFPGHWVTGHVLYMYMYVLYIDLHETGYNTFGRRQGKVISVSHVLFLLSSVEGPLSFCM